MTKHCAMAVVAFACGCFSPSPHGGLPCAPADHWCPPPQTCNMVTLTCDGVVGSGNVDAAEPACATLPIHDDFSIAGSTCGGPFTTNAPGGTITTQNSMLSITPSPGTSPTFARCELPSYDFSNGVFVHVTMIATSPGEVTSLTVYEGATPYTLTVPAAGNQLQFMNGTTIVHEAMFQPTQNPWWRLRPLAGRVYADVSADGKTWSTFGDTPGGAVTGTTARLEVTENGIDGLPSAASFASFDLCPP